MWACVPRAPLPGTDYIRTNMQKFGLWGKFCEHNGAQHVEDVSGHWTCHIYFGWDLAVVMFTVPNNIACSKIPGFVLPAPFWHTQLHLGHRDGCSGRSLLPPASLGKAVMPRFKVIKKGRDRELFIIGVHLKQGKQSCSPLSRRRRRLPSSVLVFCQAGQDPCLAGCCSWRGAENHGEKRTGLGDLATQCDPELCLVTQRQSCKERCTRNSCSRSRDCLE